MPIGNPDIDMADKSEFAPLLHERKRALVRTAWRRATVYYLMGYGTADHPPDEIVDLIIKEAEKRF